MNNCGIYCLESPSGKLYIGQSRNIHKRIKGYKGYQCKGQSNLMASLIKHGFEKHKISLLAYLPKDVSQYNLDTSEIAYIALYKSVGREMLNYQKGGGVYPMTEAGKIKLSLLKKGVSRPQYEGEGNPFYGKTHSSDSLKAMSEFSKIDKIGARNGRARAIYQYDLNMNLIKEWDTVTNASKELSIFRQAISDCLNGRIKTSGNFIWRYKQ
jgi:group I intron endonuclease